MSLQRKTTIQCPKCQETIEVGMWQSLNAHMDPEAATFARNYIFNSTE